MFEPGDLIEPLDARGRIAFVLYEARDGCLVVSWEGGYAPESRIHPDDLDLYRQVNLLDQMAADIEFTHGAVRCPLCYRPATASRWSRVLCGSCGDVPRTAIRKGR